VFPPLRLREAFNLGGLSIRELASRTWKQVGANEILTRASAISFYAMLALVPFLALLLTISAKLLPDVTGLTGQNVGVGNMTVEELRAILRRFFPADAARLAEDQIGRIQAAPPIGLLSAGLVLSLWTASSLFLAIIDAMNVIYGVTETRSMVRLRLTAIVMTLLQAAILLGSLAAIAIGPEVLAWFGFRGTSAALAVGLQWVIIVMMVLLSFALTFFVGPDAEQHWEWITPGSLFGMALFLVASLLFRVYIQHFGSYDDKVYGPLGGVMVLLFWFWISSVVLLTAGQVNKIIEDASPLGKSDGQKVDPTAPLDLKALAPEPLRET
jgi:membrane protein